MTTEIVLAVGGAVLLALLLVALVTSRLRVASPNEAFIITGRKGRAVTSSGGVVSTDLSGQKVVLGAAVFVIPVVQKLHRLDLSSRRIHVGIRGAVSARGIRCDLDGVAIVKVGGTEAAIRAAAQRFLHQQAGIDQFTSEVLAGSLRAIVGRLTVEEIIKDRAAFASAVAEESEHSLTNQGLVLDTFQLQDIQAEGTYLTDLGRPEASRVLKEAAIAEARARQSAEQERLLAEEAIAVADRQLSLKKAEIPLPGRSRRPSVTRRC
jgi:flotillin